MTSSVKINGLQHIGIPTSKMEETMEFYKKLAFQTAFATEDQKVIFLQNGGLMLELYEQPQAAATAATAGAIDHIALDVDDIEEAYRFAKDSSFHFVSEELQFLPFGKNGVKFFILLGPNGEKIELNQKL